MKRFKLLSLILSVVLLCTCFPVGSFAAANNNGVQRVANIVLFGYFSDTAEAEAEAYYAQKAQTLIKYIDGAQGRSFKNYINQISYGQMEIENIIPQYDGSTITPVKINVTESFAAVNNCDSQIMAALVSAMPDIADKTVDFDGDGIVDNIMLVVKASNENSEEGPLVSHKNNYSGALTVNGKRISPYNLFAAERIISNGSGVLAHEFLHTLGYADLYRKNGGDMPVYVWSIMASVSYNPSCPLAFERMYFTNWLTIDEVTESTSLTLSTQDTPSGNQAFILKSPFNDREIFVIEYRVRPPRDYTNENSLDYFIGGSGVIVYRVNLDATGLSNNYGQTGIYVFRPQEGMPGYSSNEQTAVYNAYFPYSDGNGTRNSIGSADFAKGLSDGALTFSDGSNSCIEIKNIRLSADGKEAYCDVTIPDLKDYDTWDNLDFLSVSASYSNSVSFETVGNAIYAVSVENNTICSRKYENGQWSLFASNIQSNGGYISKVKKCGNYLYFSFGSYDSKSYLYRYDLENGGNWQVINVINEASYSGTCVEVINDELYLAYIGEMSMSTWTSPVKLKKLSGNSLVDLGTCSNVMAGDPKIFELNGNVCVSYRKSDNTIEVFRFTGTAFQNITAPELKASIYDVVSTGSTVYFALSGEALSVAEYDGIGWTVNSLDGVPSAEVGITEKGGRVVVLSSPQEGGPLKAYTYSDGEFSELGGSVDSSSKDITVKVAGNTVYCSYVRSGDKSIMLKSKALPLYSDYDIDGNGKVNSQDYALIRSYVFCTSNLTEGQKLKADLNGDGTVDAFDALKLDLVLNEGNY